MKIVINIIVALLRAFLPAIIDASKPISEDGHKATDLRDALRNRVRGSWGRTALVLALCFAVVGCATRTVYVSDGTPVRLRETVKKAKVWVLDKDKEPVATVMDIPEGWYALPVPEDAVGE